MKVAIIQEWLVTVGGSDKSSKFFLRCKSSVIAKSGLLLSGFSKDIPSIIDGGRGCCMSFKKSIFDVIGNFDDNYYGNALREETGLFVGLKRNNMVVYYNPDVHLFHMMANTGGTRAQAFRYL